MSETITKEIVENKQMFVFDIQHIEYKSAKLWKVAHADCFAEQYKCPVNYTTSVSREIKNVPRATCEFCGGRLNPVAAAKEEAAIKKWLETGDRSDYTQVISERNKRDGIPSKSEQPKYTNLGTVTGRMRSDKPNMESVPRSNAKDVLAKLKRKGVKVSGVESGGVKIVTHQEQALSDMSKMTDEELFGKE